YYRVVAFDGSLSDGGLGSAVWSGPGLLSAVRLKIRQAFSAVANGGFTATSSHILTCLVSGSRTVPMTKVIPATTIGYQRVARMLPVALIADSPISGCKPPKTPLPIWYGSDNDVYRIFAGNASTRKAAIGPYAMARKTTGTNTSKIS